MSRWFSSLRGRITVVTVAVAVLGVLITGLIALQLVQQSTVAGARARLAAEVAVLSRSPAANSLTALTQRAEVFGGNNQLGVISPAGEPSGPAASYLTEKQVAELLSGTRLSLTRKLTDDSVLVEARRTPAGGAVVLAAPLRQVTAEIDMVQQQLWIALSVVMAAALIASALLARWLAQPLVETARTARRMATGERGLRVPRTAPSEVGDVTEALAALDLALATSEGRQREFLLSISHELRTPITAVRGYAEAIADGMVPPGQIVAVGRTLVAETERLSHFVADLLELARMEADDFSISAAPVDVTELLGQVRSAWLGRSAQLGVELVVSAAEPFPPVSSDARRLRQVLDGLVENALRAAPSGSPVTLSSSVVEERVVLAVHDAGAGLTAEDQSVAFERGALRERYRDTRPVGTGLGLSIAARLTRRLGATIEVESSPTAGTTFRVTLPRG